MIRLFCLLFWLIHIFSLPLMAGLHNDCPTGTQQCGRGTCCPTGQRCSWDGFCIPPRGEYCGGGHTCPAGQYCIAGGSRCAPHGSTRCSDGSICEPGSRCAPAGGCQSDLDQLKRPDPGSGTGGCLPGGGCSRPGWFLCEDTDSQCRPGFKCSAHRGCVPIKAIDCGYGKWCKPGEICLEGGGCGPNGGTENSGEDDTERTE